MIACFGTSVSANNDHIFMGQKLVKALHGTSATNHKQNAEEALSNYVELSEFMLCVMQGVSNCQEYIDVSNYNIPTFAMYDIAEYLFYGVPLAFNVSVITCSYNEKTNTIVSIIIEYNSFADTKEEYNACVKEISSAADELLSGIKGNNQLSDEQKLLLLHDRLIIWNTYGFPENATTIEAHTAYGALANKMSVCQGYAMAYIYLLEEVGIESYYCSSETLMHGWNIVYLDGEKYHVDVTWDDPDRVGQVFHNNFLRSSNGIYKTGHKATDYDTTPTNTKYEKYFWQNSESGFQLANNEIYYVDHVEEAIKSYGKSEKIVSVSAKWNMWVGNFTCLASDGKSIFYSQPKAVYRFDLKTDKSQKIYTPDLLSDELIFGFEYHNDIITCAVGNDANNVSKKITQSYKYDYDNESNNPEKVSGDVNNDGNINNKDCALLMQHLNGWNVQINTVNADVTGEGSINNKDCALLMQYLNNWDVTLK